MTKNLLFGKQLVEHLRDQCEAAGGIRAWAATQKPIVSASYVSAVLRGDAKPGKKLLKALGYVALRTWVKKDAVKEVVMKFENI